MLEYIALILICQLCGELLVTASGVGIPGPVIGMLLLFVFLLIKGAVPEGLEKVSSTLLDNLSLMFVPAGVGIMAHFELLGANAWPLMIAVFSSTVLTIVVTALIMQSASRNASSASSAMED